MDSLIIQEDKDLYSIPYVHLDAQTGKCIIEGESFIEDTLAFYEPVVEWVEKFCNNATQPIHFVFKLNYYNTSSSKSYHEIVTLLKKAKDDGRQVTIDWYYPEDDDDIKEEGQDFIRFIKIDINVIPFAEK